MDYQGCFTPIHILKHWHTGRCWNVLVRIRFDKGLSYDAEMGRGHYKFSSLCSALLRQSNESDCGRSLKVLIYLSVSRCSAECYSLRTKFRLQLSSIADGAWKICSRRLCAFSTLVFTCCALWRKTRIAYSFFHLFRKSARISLLS